MSNDLISRKALMKIFSETIDGRRMPEYDCDGFPITLSLSEIKKFIRQAPIAYDIDAVCDAMKKSPTYHGPILDEDGFAEEVEPLILVDDAIEIVRNGGRK